MKKYITLSIVLLALVVVNSAEAKFDFFGLFGNGSAEINKGRELRKPELSFSPKPSRSPQDLKTDLKAANSKDVDVACVKNAIEKRDTAVIAGVNAYQSAVTSGLSIRKEALKSAWDNLVVKDRREAVKNAEQAFQKTVREARSKMKAAHQAAWQQFKTDMKACKAQPGDDPGSASVDSVI